MTTNANMIEAVPHPSLRGLGDRLDADDAAIVHDGTTGLCASARTAHFATDARMEVAPLVDGGSGEPAGVPRWRSHRVGAGVWARRIAAAVIPLVSSIAIAAPAFAWPECAC